MRSIPALFKFDGTLILGQSSRCTLPQTNGQKYHQCLEEGSCFLSLVCIGPGSQFIVAVHRLSELQTRPGLPKGLCCV